MTPRRKHELTEILLDNDRARTEYRVYGIDSGEIEFEVDRWRDTLQEAMDDSQRWLNDKPRRDEVGVQCRQVSAVEKVMTLRSLAQRADEPTNPAEGRAEQHRAVREAARRLIAADMAGEPLAPHLAALEDLSWRRRSGFSSSSDEQSAKTEGS